MNKLVRITDRTWDITSKVASVFLTVIMLLIIANIVMRRFFNAPIFGSTELVRYFSLAAASFALAQNEWFEGNIKMTLFLELVSEKLRKIILFIGSIICTAAFSYISYLLVGQAIAKYVKNDVSTELNIPIFIMAGILALGFIFLTISLLLKTIVNGYNLKNNVELDMRPYSGREVVKIDQ
ncbi:MAG: TRAP transporter small permease [Peptococcaceae bacterium]|nr:TRAP transporter small permease [Peptococcaceae bacterium]